MLSYHLDPEPGYLVKAMKGGDGLGALALAYWQIYGRMAIGPASKEALAHAANVSPRSVPYMVAKIEHRMRRAAGPHNRVVKGAFATRHGDTYYLSNAGHTARHELLPLR